MIRRTNGHDGQRSTDPFGEIISKDNSARPYLDTILEEKLKVPGQRRRETIGGRWRTADEQRFLASNYLERAAIYLQGYCAWTHAKKGAKTHANKRWQKIRDDLARARVAIERVHKEFGWTAMAQRRRLNELAGDSLAQTNKLRTVILEKLESKGHKVSSWPYFCGFIAPDGLDELECGFHLLNSMNAFYLFSKILHGSREHHEVPLTAMEYIDWLIKEIDGVIAFKPIERRDNYVLNLAMAMRALEFDYSIDILIDVVMNIFVKYEIESVSPKGLRGDFEKGTSLRTALDRSGFIIGGTLTRSTK